MNQPERPTTPPESPVLEARRKRAVAEAKAHVEGEACDDEWWLARMTASPKTMSRLASCAADLCSDREHQATARFRGWLMIELDDAVQEETDRLLEQYEDDRLEAMAEERGVRHERR